MSLWDKTKNQGRNPATLILNFSDYSSERIKDIIKTMRI
jgi:hypothetical protein